MNKKCRLSKKVFLTLLAGSMFISTPVWAKTITLTKDTTMDGSLIKDYSMVNLGTYTLTLNGTQVSPWSMSGEFVGTGVLSIMGDMNSTANVSSTMVIANDKTFMANSGSYSGVIYGQEQNVLLSFSNSSITNSMVGGYTSTNNVILRRNMVELKNNATVNGDVSGAKAEESLDNVANYNKVEIDEGASVGSEEEDRNIYGAYLQDGVANGNSVIVDGGKTYGFVYGAKVDGTDGVANSNKVTIGGGAVESDVYGGYLTSADNINTMTKNVIVISGGTVGKIEDLSTVIAGYSAGSGKVKNNSITVSDGNVYGNLSAGYSESGTSMLNKVTISGGNFTGSIMGGKSGSDGSVNSNSVTVKGGTFGSTSSVIGGYGQGNALTQLNTVSISNGNFVVGSKIIGGYSENGRVVGNEVTVNGGTISGNVFGGYSVSGDVSGNSVRFNGGSVSGKVIGGYSENGNVTNNLIYIKDSTLSGDFYAGYAVNGTASNNDIYIDGSVAAEGARFHKDYKGPSLNALVISTDTTWTQQQAEEALAGKNEVYVKDAVLTLNNDDTSAWNMGFSVIQNNSAADSTLKFIGAGFGVHQQDVELNTSTIQFVNTYADINVASIGSKVSEIVVNSTGQTKVYNLVDYTLNANVTGTNTLSIESENGKSITLGSGKTISTAIDIMKDVDKSSGELQGQGSLKVNANQFTGTADIKNAGVLTLTGGTLNRNIVAGTVRKLTGEDVDSTTTAKGEVYVTAPLTIADGVSVTADIYGAKGSGSTAITGKNVSISGGTISDSDAATSYILAAYSEGTGDLTNNTLTLKNITITKTYSEKDRMIFGAVSKEGEILSNNKVVLENVVLDGCEVNAVVAGGNNVISNGTASYNSLIVTNSSGIKAEFWGTTANTVRYNSVEINGGTYSKSELKIIGACNANGVAEYNTLTFNGGTFGGGRVTAIAALGHYGDGNIKNNSVVFNDGTFTVPLESGVYIENVLCGGLAEGDGHVTNNSVTVSGGTFTRTSVIGGRSKGKGNVNGNTITITGGTFVSGEHNGISGGVISDDFDSTVTSNVTLGSANNNKVTMTDVTINSVSASYWSVYGGYICLEGFNKNTEAHKTALKNYYSDGGASGNTVEITTDKNVVFKNVFGGSTVTGDADNNTVKLSGANIVAEHHVVGGLAGGDYYDRAGIVASAHGNKVYLTGITTKRDVAGGRGTYHDENNAGSEANNNEVHIDGGTYLNTEGKASGIVGGEAWSKASGNITEIKNATVGVSGVIGGWIYSLAGTVTNNKVIIDNVTFDFDGDNKHGGNGTFIAGGGCETDGIFTGTRSGNSLEIGSNGFVVNTDKAVTIQNFDSMTSAEGATVTNNGTLTFTNNGVKDAGEGDVEVIWSGKIAGTGKLVVNYGDFTVDNVVSNAGGIEINEGGKFRVKNADDIQTSVVNNNNMNLYSGTLTQTVDNTNGTIKIHGVVGLTQKVSGGLIEIKENGSTLRLDNGTADKLVINELVAYNYYGDEKPRYKDTVNKISFDAGSTVVDQVSAYSYKGTITLGAVGLTEDFAGNVGTYVGYYQLFTGTTDFSEFAINGSAEVVLGEYKYVFSDSGLNDGRLKVYKDYGYTLQQIISNANVGGKQAGIVTNYSLNGDKTETVGLGTLTRVSGASSRELTINGNSYTLTAPTGITVNSGDTLTLKDITYDVSSGNAVSGYGTTNIVGNVTVSDKIATTLGVLENSTLNILFSNIGGTVVNDGTLNLTDNNVTFNKNITGSGVVTNGGTMTFNSTISVGGNDIKGNNVVLNGATVTGDATYGDQVIAGKTVNITNSSIRYANIAGVSSSGNTVTIGSNTQIGHPDDIKYDEIYSRVIGSPVNGTDDVTGNTVTVSGANIKIYDCVHGGHSEDLANIKDNTVTINGTDIFAGNIAGGEGDFHGSSGSPVEVSGNTVNVTGANISEAMGGVNHYGTVTDNHVALTNTTVFQEVDIDTWQVDTSVTTDEVTVAGGRTTNSYAVTDNTVILNNVIAYGAVAAAVTDEGGTGDGIKGNTLTINGGAYQGIYGGSWCRYKDPIVANISETTVTVENAIVVGSIIAGRTHGYSGPRVEKESDIVVGHYGLANGNVTDNEVTVNGVTFKGNGTTKNVELSGGTTLNLDAEISGNILNIGANGITVAADRVLSIKNFDTITPADGATITNNGVVAIDNVPLDGRWNVKISGSGTTSLNTDAEITNVIGTKVTVPVGVTVNTLADNLTNTVANSGRLYLEGGILAKGVTGTGSLYILDDTELQGLVNNAITVAYDVDLTIGAGNIGSTVSNNGTVYLGAGTLTGTISNGDTIVNGNVTAAADRFSNTSVEVNSDNVLTLTGSTLSSSVTGEGTTVIAGSVTLAAGTTIGSGIEVNAGKTFTVSGTLTGRTYNYGTINLCNGSVVSKQITSKQTGGDTVNITGTITENATDTGKYGIGASILNITNATVDSDYNHSLRAFTTTITNSIVNDNVVGLWHNNAEADYAAFDNTITITNSEVSRTVVGGRTSTYQTVIGDVYNNLVTADNSYVNYVIGGNSEIYDSSDLTQAYTTGNVYGNKVILKNGSQVGHEGNYTDHIIGGQAVISPSGESSSYFSKHKVGYVSDNSVTINDSTIHSNIYGGYSNSNTKIFENSVSISDSDLYVQVIAGGYDYSQYTRNSNPYPQEVTGNTVTITNTNINTDLLQDAMIVGGWSRINAARGYADVKENEVTITLDAGHVAKLSDVVGGAAWNYVDTLSGSEILNTAAAYKNKVTLVGNTIDVYNKGGGVVCGGVSGAGLASYNEVSITGGTYAIVYGGYSKNGSANNNTVNINSGTLVGENTFTKYAGGYSHQGDANGNTITIGNGTDSVQTSNMVWIIGGVSLSDDVENLSTGTANNNTIMINGNVEFNTNDDAIKQSVHIVGGRTDNGDISGNTVNITGVTINAVTGVNQTNNINGGYSGGSGNVTNNSVTVTNSNIVVNNIRGGYSESGNVYRNNVMLVGNTTVSGQVYGGYSTSGQTYDNTITLIDIDLTGSTATFVPNSKTSTPISASSLGKIEGIRVLGGYDASGVEGSNVIVNVVDGSSTSNLTGVFVTTQKLNICGNGVNLMNGQADYVYGGRLYNSDSVNVVRGNFVYIGNSGSADKAFGGFIDNGDGTVINNIVYVSGGTIASYVYGGYGRKNVEGNRVYMLDAVFNGLAIAGDSLSGVANNNEVYVKNVTGSGDVEGAKVFNSTGSAISNTVYFDNSSLRYAYGGNADKSVSNNRVCVYNNSSVCAIGGNSSNGNAQDNIVKSYDSYISGYGGRAERGQANNNVFEAHNCTLGFEIYGANGGEGVLENRVIIDGSNTDSGLGIWYEEIYGGRTYSGIASGNEVNISNSTIGTESIFAHIYGGYSELGAVNSNMVNICNDSVRGAIYCGYSQSGNIMDNTVTITGGTVSGNVYGGYSSSGAVTNNTVIISSGTISGNVYGGYSSSGAVTNNTVNITGGTISGNVYGGYTQTGTVSGNTVTVSGTAVVDKAKIYQNYKLGATNTSLADEEALLSVPLTTSAPKMMMSAPKLTSAASTATSATPTDTTSAEQNQETESVTNEIVEDTVTMPLMMTSTPKLTMAATPVLATSTPKSGTFSFSTDSTGQKAVGLLDGFATIEYKDVTWNNGVTILKINDWAGSTIDGSNINLSNINITGGSQIKAGDTMKLINSEDAASPADLPVVEDIVIDTQAGIAQLVTLQSKPDTLELKVTKAEYTPQTLTIGETSAVAAAFINQGHDMVEQVIQQIATASEGMEIFAGMNTNKSKYETGSHVDIKGHSIIAGTAKTLNNGLSYGIFYEQGNADYDTYADAAHGEGKTNYKGAGIVITKKQKNGFYTEGSLRTGKLNNQLRNGIKDHLNNNLTYDYNTFYYGGHIGLGRKLNIGNNNELDIYGKYIYAHNNGTNFELDGDRFRLEDVNSHRIKLGARINRNINNKFTFYYGASYEYGFNGDINSSVNGMDLKKHSIGGGTAIFEIGTKLISSSKWDLDFNMKGFLGQRRGGTFSIQAAYKF